MNKINTTWILLVILLLISCKEKKPKLKEINYKIEKDRDSLDVIINENIPSKNLDIKLERLFSLRDQNKDNDFFSFFWVSVSNNNRIDVVDMNSSSTYAFDSSGKFISKNLKKGNGPGEIPNDIWYFSVIDSLIYASTFFSKIVVYDNKYNYLRDIDLGLKKLIEFRQITGLTDSTNIIAVNYRGNNTNIPKDSYKQISEIAVTDKNLKTIKVLKRNEKVFKRSKKVKELDLTKFKGFYDFTINKEALYIAGKSEDSYEVEVYSLKGEKKYTFKKETPKVRYSNKEKKLINENMDSHIQSGGPQGMTKIIYTKEFKDKILYIFTDDKGRVWVNTSFYSINASNIRRFDIFKDGIYLNSIDIPVDRYDNDFPLDIVIGDFIIKNNRFYKINRAEGDIEAYEIK